MSPDHLRLPPQSIEAEQHVLGGILLAGSEALRAVAETLDVGDFYRREHAAMWQAIADLEERHQPIDVFTVEAALPVGTVPVDYTVTLATQTPSAANIRAYAQIVRDKALLRRLIQVGTRIVDGGFQPDGRDTEELIAFAQQQIIDLIPQKSGGLELASASLSDWCEDLQRRSEAPGRVTGMPTPWQAVNEHTHGLQKGELTIIAGRPSMGKSIAAENLARFAALRGHRVALFSLEMTMQQILRRGISALSEVPHDWLLAPEDTDASETHWGRMQEAIRQIKSANLFVDETADLTVAQMMARARRLHIRDPIDLLVVDHIHDFKIDPARARFEYGKVAQGIKTLAKEFDCPAVALAQLNRENGKRVNKRPVMSDLRESGELEQKGDLILFLHREDYYEPTVMPGVAELIVAKGRDIEAGKTLYLRNDYAHMALRDWDGPNPCPSKNPCHPTRSGWGAR